MASETADSLPTADGEGDASTSQPGEQTDSQVVGRHEKFLQRRLMREQRKGKRTATYDQLQQLFLKRVVAQGDTKGSGGGVMSHLAATLPAWGSPVQRNHSAVAALPDGAAEAMNTSA